MTLESALYSKLRDLRQQIASEKRLPAYCIFSNKALEEMASAMPSTSDEFASIYGVGKTKLRQYGEKFLAEIQSFREENGISEPFSPPVRTAKRKQTADPTVESPLDIVVVYPEKAAELITIENYEELKASLQELLENYNQLLYTPDQLKQAKQDKATLNKLKKAIGARRKEIRDICLEPFYHVDAQLKELQQMIDVPLVKIAEFTSEMSQMQRDTKSANIKLYYDQNAKVLGSVAEGIFYSSWFYNTRWENKTTPDWSWQSDIRQKTKIIAQEINELSEIAGEYSPAVIAKYVETGSKEQAIQFFHSITTIKEDIEHTDLKPNVSFLDQHRDGTSLEKEQVQKTSEMLIKISGTQQQYQAALQYLKEIGIKYEVFVLEP